jgi:hypothetical protein
VWQQYPLALANRIGATGGRWQDRQSPASSEHRACGYVHPSCRFVRMLCCAEYSCGLHVGAVIAVVACMLHAALCVLHAVFEKARTKTEFETKIISKISGLISRLISKVSTPDEATEIELNSQSTNRWKIKFEELTTHYKEKPKDFIDSIVNLGKLNKKNPSIENIFFEASKFIEILYHCCPV